MKLIQVLLAYLIFSGLIYPQSKYLIYFTDKEIDSHQILKSQNIFDIASRSLSQKAIKRRRRTMGKEFFKFEDLPINSKYINKLKKNSIKIKNALKWFNAVSAYLNKDQIDFVRKLSFVKKIEPVKSIYFNNPSEKILDKNDRNHFEITQHLYDYGPSLTQYELSEIPEVHDLGIDGKDVIIGILDTGFRWKEIPTLRNANVLAEHDFIFNDSETSNELQDRSDQDSHGTWIFSVLGGFNEGKIVGPAFMSGFVLAKTENVKSETHVEEDNYAAALEWMDSIGVDITTSSLGYSVFDDSVFSYTYNDMDGKTTIVTKAAELAFERGILTITAAGNEGNKPWKYITAPGDGKNTLTVGAVNSSNKVAAFSSVGPTADGRIKPDVVAQGVKVYVASVDSSFYLTLDGTSLSTPIVAGIAGLLKSKYRFLTNKQIRNIFLETGDNALTPDNFRGYGLVSAKRAISYPVFEELSNKFILHKIFIDSVGISPGSAKLIYSKVNEKEWKQIKLIQINSYEFITDLSLSELNDEIEFRFEYDDLSNNHVVDPNNANYLWSPKDKNVHFHLKIIPENFMLYQNYPNPFNNLTTIRYDITSDNLNSEVDVKLIIYDILGRKVSQLINTKQKPGKYSISFINNRLASGVYFYSLKAGNFIKTKKMILLK